MNDVLGPMRDTLERLRAQLAAEGIRTVGEPSSDPMRGVAEPLRIEENHVVAVIRKGKRVFVGNPRGQGMWFDHINAQLARVTEAGLKARLARGWPGSFEMLMDVVNRDLQRNVDRRRHQREMHEAGLRQAERRQRGRRMRRWG